MSPNHSNPLPPPDPSIGSSGHRPLRPPAPRREAYVGLPQPVDAPRQHVKFRPQRRKGLRLLLIVGALVALFGVTGSAAYYGFVAPMQPEQLWASAMTNSARGYDALVEHSQPSADAKGSDVQGTFSTDGTFKTDGSFGASWFDGNGTAKLDVGLGVTRAVLESRVLRSTSTNPDVYLNVSGLKGVGNQLKRPELEPLIAQTDGQWIALDHTLLDNYQKQLAPGSTAVAAQLTAEDGKQMAQKLGEALDQHIFTVDPAHAVFTMTQKVGKERREGRPTYHFKATIHKDHLKEFVSTLHAKLGETKLKGVLDGPVASAFSTQNLSKRVDALNTDSLVVDAWVDTQTKAFQAVRIPVDARAPASNYLEFTAPYHGGSEVPLGLKLASTDGATNIDADARLTLNTQTNESKLAVTATQKTNWGTNALKLNLTAKPRTQALTVEKPAAAKPLAEVLAATPIITLSGAPLQILPR